MACDGEEGLRPPIERITSPLRTGRLESLGAFTTRTPSFVPKYSPRSGFRFTSSRSPQGDPNDSAQPSMPAISGISAIPGATRGIVIASLGISIRNEPPRSAAPSATPITIHVGCIIRCSSGASQPHVSGAGDVHRHELLHRVHPLLPQFHEFGAAHGGFRHPHLRQLAVDGGNAVLQRGRERRRTAARDPLVGVVALELRLERRRLLLHPLELGRVDAARRARPDQEQQRDTCRHGEAPRPPAAPLAALLDAERVAHRQPPVPGRPAHRQRFKGRDALIQGIELRPARRARLEVLPGPGRRLVLLEGQQVVDRAMHHGAAPSASSIRRSRACARASCDLEQLTVLPISSAISSWVYPSTSCNHTTERDVSLNRSKARSRSIRAGAPATAPGPSCPVAASACPACTPTASSSNSSVTRTWLRRIRIRAFDAAMRLIQPHRCPSPRYCLMLRTTSRNVSCSTSSASSGVRSMRSARLYTGVSKARYSASSASRSPARARATRMSGTASEMVIS